MKNLTMVQIHPNLYLRGHTRGCNANSMMEVLAEKNIRMVLNVAIIKDDILAAACRTVGIDYVHEPMSDGRGLETERVIALIERLSEAIKKYPVLIHCDSGRNRSSLIAIPAVARSTSRSTEEILAEARKARPIGKGGLLGNSVFRKFVLGYRP